MRSFIFVILLCVCILSVLLLLLRFIAYANDIDSEELNRRDERFKSKVKHVRMNAHPDHLIWFVQVC